MDPTTLPGAQGASPPPTDANAAPSTATTDAPNPGAQQGSLQDTVLATAAASLTAGGSPQGSGTGPVPDADRLPAAGAVTEPPPTTATQQVDDPYKDLPFHQHPRFQEVYGKAKERDDFERKVREAEGTVQQWKPLVEAQNATQEYCRANGITVAQFRELLETQAMINRGAPKDAFAKIKPVYDRLAALNGQPTSYDPDIADALRAGKIDEQWASQVQAGRASTQWQQTRQQMTEYEAQQAQTQQNAQAVAQWTRDMQLKDTAFKPSTTGRKGVWELTDAFLNSAWAVTPPRNVLEAVRLADQAYKDARDLLVAQATPPAPRGRPLPQNGSSATVTQPKTLQDVVFGVADGSIKVER